MMRLVFGLAVIGGLLFSAWQVRADGSLSCFELTRQKTEDRFIPAEFVSGNYEPYQTDFVAKTPNYEFIFSGRDLSSMRVSLMIGKSMRMMEQSSFVPILIPPGSKVINAISPEFNYGFRFNQNTGEGVLVNLSALGLLLVSGSAPRTNVLLPVQTSLRMKGNVQVQFLTEQDLILYSEQTAEYALYRIENHGFDLVKLGSGKLLDSSRAGKNHKKVTALEAKDGNFIEVRNGDGRLFRIEMNQLKTAQWKTGIVIPIYRIDWDEQTPDNRPVPKQIEEVPERAIVHDAYVKKSVDFVRTAFGDIEIPIGRVNRPMIFHKPNG